MKLITEANTGKVIRCLVDSIEPDEGQTIRDITPDIQAVLDQGGPFKWVPDDENNWAGSGTLIKIVPTLEEAKAAKKAELAAARYEQEMGGFQLPPEQGGMFVRTDARNRTLLNAAAIRAGADPAYEVPNWKTAEGTFITLSNAMILHLNGAVEQFIAAQFAKEASLSAQIDSATSVEEVSAITW